MGEQKLLYPQSKKWRNLSTFGLHHGLTFRIGRRVLSASWIELKWIPYHSTFVEFGNGSKNQTCLHFVAQHSNCIAHLTFGITWTHVSASSNWALKKSAHCIRDVNYDAGIEYNLNDPTCKRARFDLNLSNENWRNNMHVHRTLWKGMILEG